MPVSIAGASLFYIGPSVERCGGAVLSIVCLRDGTGRELDKANLDSMDAVRRNRSSHSELAIVDKRTGSGQPLQFLSSLNHPAVREPE
jgi:hypothetical protein